MSVLDQLATYLSYPFVVNALVVGVLVALCSALLGTTLVMKRLSFIGDGLSHVAFGAYAVAAVAGVTHDMLVIAPATVLAAVLLLRRGQSAEVKGDAAIAMMSVTTLAAVLGVVCALVGMLASILLGTPVGSTIVMLDALAFALFCLVGKMRGR